MKLKTHAQVATQVAAIIGLMGACGEDAPALGTPYTPIGASTAGTIAPPLPGVGGTAAPTGAAGRAGIPAITPPMAQAGTGVSNAPVTMAVPPQAVTDSLPCDVSKALTQNCQKCHGASPMFGAPMSLVTYADIAKPVPTDPTQTYAQLALKRINDKASPMPPGGAMSELDKKMLSDWLSAGAKPTKSPASCVESTAPTAGSGGSMTPPALHDEAYFKAGLTALPGETCHDLPVHGGQTASDTTPYSVATGEHYEQFYIKIPWGAGQVMTRFGTKFDNLKVVHHWLLFTTNRPESQHGTHETTVGSTLGDDSQLLAGWAVGGDNVEFPADVGLEVPASGILNAQWHYYNTGTAVTTDSSKIQVCTVPAATRKNTASLTFLGTENFNGPFGMPAKTMSDFGGSCTNNSAAPVTIYGFTPHMHKLGRHMKAVVQRAGGMTETVFDKVFDFNAQITYILEKQIVLQPGDTITSTCTFDNNTNAAVPFGPSTTQEMCYNFTMAYPARQLDNGTLSLIGATNVCW